MNIVSGRLQVFFEAPFWVGVFEQVCDGKLSVCKVTFGAEPKDSDIQQFILKHYDMLPFSPAMDYEEKSPKRLNPKRLHREVKKQIANAGIGTKSQQALKLQHQQGKQERKACFRKRQEAEKQFRFELKQQKKKEKHKGR